MRKIPSDLENPIDNAIIYMCEPMSKFFRTLNFNPNDITTLSLIFGILSVILLYKNKPVLSVACFFISYIFDCADGYYARKYRMCTKLGDLYDHIKDWTVNITYGYILFTRNRHKLPTYGWIIVLFVLLILLGMQSLYFGAQEKYYDKLDQVPSLAWLGKMIKNKEQAKKVLKIVRYFGCGTFIVCVMFFTLWIENRK
jgi:phosphatidylglycerophosphate synthase